MAPTSLDKSDVESTSAGRKWYTPEETFRILAGGIRKLPSQERTVAFCRGLVRELSFVELHMRHDIIAKAHRDTFSWIYERDELGFNDWAQGDSGR
jgi:hypothetical protein